MIKALVIASFGRHVIAQNMETLATENPTPKLWQAYPKGKKQDIAVGDVVLLKPTSDTEAWIECIEPRRNLLYRQEGQRSKWFAANLDLVLLMIAPKPKPQIQLMARAWLACKAANIPLQVVINKSDIIKPEEHADILKQIEPWCTHPMLLSAKSATVDCDAPLWKLLEHKTTLLLGQSGVGKSTLLNALVPEAQALTQTLSAALQIGKHTTTHTRMHLAKNNTHIIDSPGFQSFGIDHLKNPDLAMVFESITLASQQCRFANCKHMAEPFCMVKQEVSNGTIHPEHLQLYQSLMFKPK